MHNVYLDFETFYSKDFSLSKLTTQQYVESPVFEIILVSAAREDEYPKWFSGTLEETAEWLRQFDIENSCVIAHNALFDGYILERRLGLQPQSYYCTMFGASPLVGSLVRSLSLKSLAQLYNIGEKGTEVLNALGKHRRDFTPAELDAYAGYCVNDVALCRMIAHIQRPALPAPEQAMISETIKKFTRPQLRVDRELLIQQRSEIKERKEKVLAELGLEDRSTLMSNNKFAEALRKLGVTPPTKPSPSDPAKSTYAFAKTDSAMRELLEHENPAVAALAEARLVHKSTIEDTRAKRFLETTEHTGGLLGVPLRYWGAHTGRFSGLDLNMQNLAKKSVLRKAIRAAKPEHVVLAGDLSQIEARLVAELAGETALTEAFAAGRDVYCDFGSILYGTEITEKTHPKERFVSKCAVLMLSYGAGATKFYHTMKAWGVEITQNEADRIVYTYRNTYANIRNLWRTLDRAVEAMACGGQFDVERLPVQFGFRRWKSPCGLDILYPRLAKREDDYAYQYRLREWRRLYGGALLENICQHLGRTILAEAELRMAKHGLHAAMSIHDELVYTVHKDKAEQLKQLLEIELTRGVDWLPNLPIACEAKYGETYANCK